MYYMDGEGDGDGDGNCRALDGLFLLCDESY
jgi:hypothetical protein